MKVYISVDMEGVACVTHPDHITLKGGDYGMARKWMTAEVNAAIEGALEAGATEVVVADSHGRMCNLLPDELHEDALLVRGSPRPLSMMAGLDESFDAVFFVGYHSMAGTLCGVLSHTFDAGSIYAMRLNGIAVGEPGVNAAIAGCLGVPVALSCGDDSLDAEVSALMPQTERVITKWAISWLSARNLTPKASQKRIRQGAKRALARLSEIKPWVLETPVRLEIDFIFPISPYIAADVPGVEPVNARTIAYTGADLLEIIRICRLIFNASSNEAFAFL